MNEMKIAAKIENWEQVSEFAETLLDEQDCPMRAKMQLLVALEELFVNVSHYAYGGQTGEIQINLRVKDGFAFFTLLDSGVPFDPLQKTDPDTSLPMADRPIGGLGIFMVKKTMDVFDYAYENGQNKVTIGKRIAG